MEDVRQIVHQNSWGFRDAATEMQIHLIMKTLVSTFIPDLEQLQLRKQSH